MVLYVDDEQTLMKPLQLDLRNGCGVREYLQLIQRIGSHRKDHMLSANREKFTPCYNLFAFTLSSDQYCAGPYSLNKREKN